MILGSMGIIRSRTFINTNAFEYAEVGTFSKGFLPSHVALPLGNP